MLDDYETLKEKPYLPACYENAFGHFAESALLGG